MMEFEPADTFRGLPLTAEQDSEIRHYIHVRQRAGLPGDTPELDRMLADMLDPPDADEANEEDRRWIAGGMDKERSAAAFDGAAGRDGDGAPA